MRNRVVLVAEDDASIRWLVRLALEEMAEVRVVLAEDGDQALRKIEEERPDLVLLDVMMPRMSGLEVLGRLRAQPATRGIPVVLMSAVHHLLPRTMGVGYADFLEKPFDLDSLLEKVRLHLSREETAQAA